MAVSSSSDLSDDCSSSSLDMDQSTTSEEVTLVDAIKVKYCSGPEKYYNDEVLPVFRVIKEFASDSKPGVIPIQKQTHIIVEGKNITSSGSGKELADMCTNLIELDMRDNQLSSWNDIFVILSSIPTLKILNLSCNKPLLNATASLPLPHPHLSLTRLYLSCTPVSFTSVVSVMETLPNVTELHLSYNSYTDEDIQIKQCPSHHNLTHLYIIQNELSRWKSIECIGDIFPNLHFLMLNGNPLQSIEPRKGRETLRSLQTLHLNEAQISQWECIDNLIHYPSLKSVSLLRNNLGRDLAESERRYLIIARIPGLEYLNKSIVSKEEREDAERWLLRTYNSNDSDSHSSPPPIYEMLLKKHGHVEPLSDVNMLPEREIKLTFTYDGIERDSEEIFVNIMQTTRTFKRWIAQKILIPPSKLRLFYSGIQDGEVYSKEELRMPSKYLYTYRMRDGDMIEVVVKE